MKKNKSRIILAIQSIVCVIVVLLGTFDKNKVPSGDLTIQLIESGVALDAGVYDIKVTYSASEDIEKAYEVKSETAMFNTVRSNTVSVFADESESICRVYLKDSVDDLKVIFNENPKTSLEVTNIEIEVISTHYWTILFGLLCGFALFDVFMLIYNYNKKYGMNISSQISVAVLVITYLCASFPLMVDYVLNISGMSELLLNIDKAVNEPFSNILLSVPILLGKIGFSINSSVRIYIALINLITLMMAYLVWNKIIKDDVLVTPLTVIYVLCPWRMRYICDIISVEKLWVYVLLIIPVGIFGGFIFNVYMLRKAEKGKAGKVLIGAAMVTMLFATYKTNYALHYTEPLWVYSMSDMRQADGRDIGYLVYETYGIQYDK